MPWAIKSFDSVVLGGVKKQDFEIQKNLEHKNQKQKRKNNSKKASLEQKKSSHET